MANRKELPREKRMKEQLTILQMNYENLLEELRQSNDIREKQQRSIENLQAEVTSLDRINRQYRTEFSRNRKLIDFLIDSKL